jgi:hypothetical protein
MSLLEVSPSNHIQTERCAQITVACVYGTGLELVAMVLPVYRFILKKCARLKLDSTFYVSAIISLSLLLERKGENMLF